MRTLLAAAFVFALAGPGASSHCATYSTSQADVDALGMWYFTDDDGCRWGFPECGLWIYEESNGIQGLQRGDLYVDDTCHNAIEPDTIIF